MSELNQVEQERIRNQAEAAYPYAKQERPSTEQEYWIEGYIQGATEALKSLPTKEEAIQEGKDIERQAEESGDPESVRQSETMKYLFVAGAFYARKWKKPTT